jgi:nucleoside-diphosphate-sugar epimerase
MSSRPQHARGAPSASGALEAYRGVRALVLGGSGFIGAWVARALERAGAIVTIAVRNPHAAITTAGPIAIVHADLTEPDALARVLAQARPQIAFNLVGYGVEPSQRDASAMAVINAGVVDALCAALASIDPAGWTGASLVHTGSALEYGPVDGSVREETPAKPTTDYGRTKLRATQSIQRCASTTRLRAVVGRLFTVYGPGEHDSRLLPALLRTARTKQPLALTDGRQPRDFTYVEDAAEGLLRLGASAAAPGTVVNIATSQLTTVREFAETAAAVLGFDRTLLEFGALPTRAEEMWHGAVDVTRLRDLVSWVPASTVAEGIRRTLEFRDAA